MSYFEGLSCPVCNLSFVADDDMVVCPQCGLPHHRTCWKSIGHCYENSKHGTAEQWSRDTSASHESTNQASEHSVNVCPKCNTENAQYAEFCSRCGCELSSVEWHSSPTQTPPVREYAPYRSPFINEDSYTCDEKLDGVEAAHLANVVGINKAYYMPRFQRLSQKKSGGWNWAAFLLSPYWLFYRKMYWLGAIYFSILMAIKVAGALLPADVEDPVIMAIASSLAGVWLAMSVFVGLKGNAFYYAHCRRKVRKVKEKAPDITPTELSACGGVSVGIALLFVVFEEIGGLLIATITPTLL